jgi:hypothetical protein
VDGKTSDFSMSVPSSSIIISSPPPKHLSSDFFSIFKYWYSWGEEVASEDVENFPSK